MKTAMAIIDALVLVIYLVALISTYLKLKKADNKKVELVKEDILKRVTCMNVLTLVLAILGITTIILKRLNVI